MNQNKKTMELEQLLKHASEDDLKTYIHDLQEPSFIQFFNDLLIRYDLQKSDVITKTNLDRTYAYQILQGKKLGSKDKVFQFALAIPCSFEECNKLLQLSNNGKLYAKQKRDAILINALEKKLSIYETNDLLYELDENILD